MDEIRHLREEIAARESELARLRACLATKQAHQGRAASENNWKWPLEEDEYQRYGRQMIVPNFGLQGQRALGRAKVLLVGAGGLGCPAAAYLAGSGVGVLGLVDGDEVEMSNLHRQIAHSTARVGTSKVESAITFLRELNPSVTYRAHATHLTPQNAGAIVSQYHLVLDCTDHPTSRYLISDVCVLLGKPLVSAAAFQTSGQLIVLNSPAGRGPCYRCVFPRPPPPESVVGCGEGGIVGPVVGVMGVLQALEAIKLVCGAGRGPADSAQAEIRPTMLLFNGVTDGAPFRSVRMRGRRSECSACGENAQLTLERLASSMDYVQFCGVTRPVRLLRPEERVTAQEYQRLAASGATHVLVDVRDKEHFSLSHIPGSINVPIGRFTSHRGGDTLPEGIPADLPADVPIYVVCRVGNDSQIAAAKLKELGLDRNGHRFVGDILGGLRSWKDSVDDSLPFL
ncbi:Molybdenum cofactor biosynthesis, MoeB [Metarhizium album ARSEF 1941]|uniref:Adenylyltransferase and sulfurtransferase uba4 n=1 Tax=Metarhizium album (strain ARSEF 1941) TaxID=1081103 RepID=A0A0B2WY17_METAS|nr:Molybdenum cofactor biosynthesis, MoeB [Metarhizium album ARSEF 1941]KHN98948.1 Molybdenum cofactor biosynthesis, MoeB [Metarhizium album ARSEF 1941]